MQIIQRTVAGLTLGDPVVHRQMAMFPLVDVKEDASARAYLTLDEALASTLAQVSEVSNGGSVPELIFRNLSDKPVLLVEGEELVGAKQNRTLNVSILAPPKEETRIPVSCVEQGRWGDDDNAVFDRSDRAHFARGRRSTVAAVNQAMRHDPTSRRSDQGAVWENIAEKMDALPTASETGAMGDIYEQHRTSIDTYVGAFRQQPGQVGAVFLAGTQFAGLDLFAHASAFAVLFPKLVRSYALDAMELRSAQAFKPPASAGRRLLDAVAAADAREYPAVGQGRDVRIDSASVTAAALVAEGAVLHLAAFRREGEGEGSNSGRYRQASRRRANRMRDR